jgi:hypothetical protein
MRLEMVIGTILRELEFSESANIFQESDTESPKCVVLVQLL